MLRQPAVLVDQEYRGEGPLATGLRRAAAERRQEGRAHHRHPENPADRLDHLPSGHATLFVLLYHLFGQIPLEPLRVVHDSILLFRQGSLRRSAPSYHAKCAESAHGSGCHHAVESTTIPSTRRRDERRIRLNAGLGSSVLSLRYERCAAPLSGK